MTTVIETEAPTTTLITIEPSAAQSDLQKMIERVKRGGWCKGKQHDEHGRDCTVGMIGRIRA